MWRTAGRRRGGEGVDVNRRFVGSGWIPDIVELADVSALLCASADDVEACNTTKLFWRPCLYTVRAGVWWIVYYVPRPRSRILHSRVDCRPRRSRLRQTREYDILLPDRGAYTIFLHTLARKFAKRCTFCGRELTGYSHVIYWKHVTIICNFPAAKRACFGELSAGVCWKNGLHNLKNKIVSAKRVWIWLVYYTTTILNAAE